ALRKTTLGPGQLLHGMVAFALDRPFPVTLTLRHLDSAAVSFPAPCDMGRFVLETDETVPVSKQAPDPRRPEPGRRPCQASRSWTPSRAYPFFSPALGCCRWAPS